ncbi:MAG: DUF1540 domain-containing protein [Clostridia bacterium]
MSKKIEPQKIECSVVDCAHNCVKDCTCKLEKISVCPCGESKEAKKDENTLCSSYHYVGNLNVEEVLNNQ